MVCRFGTTFDEEIIWGQTGEYANGNSALMRILPVCPCYINRQKQVGTSGDEAIYGIHRVTGLTHNHLRSHMTSGLYYGYENMPKEWLEKMCLKEYWG